MGNIYLQSKEYLESLRVLNMSARTVGAYDQHLKLFARYCEKQGFNDYKDLTLEDLRDYQRYLLSLPGKKAGSKLSPETLNFKMRIVKKVFEFLERRQELLINPAEKLDLPPLKDRLPKDILSEKEVLSLLNAPNISTKLGIRDRAILEFLYSTAIRREELCSLSVFDIDMASGIARIKGKGNKERIVPVGKKSCEYLKLYLSKSRPLLNKDPDCKYLWLGLYNKPLEGEAVNCIVKKYAEQAAIKRAVTIHTLRRSAATHMLRGNAHPLYVQRLLGHSTGWTLRKYVKLSAKDIKEEHNKKHPREKNR